MNLNRRNFLATIPVIAALPPMPPMPPKSRVLKRLESPKGKEHRKSLTHVRSVTAEVAPSPAPPQVSTVLPGSFAITSIKVTGNVVTITWQNGIGPFQVQKRTSLTAAWQNVGDATSLHTASIPVTTPNAFFRVQQQIALVRVSRENGVTQITWSIPTV